MGHNEKRLFVNRAPCPLINGTPRTIDGTRARSRQGISLIEVLISAVILAVGAVVVLQAMAKAAYAQTVIDRQTGAYLFVLSKMADLALLAREGQVLPEQDDGTFREGCQTFTWTVATAPAFDDPSTRAVTLSISWQTGGSSEERRLETWLRLPPANPVGQ